MATQKKSPSSSSQGSKNAGPNTTVHEDKGQADPAAIESNTTTEPVPGPSVSVFVFLSSNIVTVLFTLRPPNLAISRHFRIYFSTSLTQPKGTKHAYVTSDPISPLTSPKSDSVSTFQMATKKPKLDHADPFAGPSTFPGFGYGSAAINMSSYPSTTMTTPEPSAMDQILSSLRLGHLVSATTASNVNIVVTSEETPTTPTATSIHHKSDAELLAKLQQQQAKLEAQQLELAGKDVQYQHADARMEEVSTPSTSYGGPVGGFASAMANEDPHPAATASANALLQHQQQRISALQSQLAQREQQLAMTQNQAAVRPSALNLTTSSPTEASFQSGNHHGDSMGGRRASVFNANAPPFMSRQAFSQAPVSPTAMSDTQSVANSEYNVLNRPMYGQPSFNPMRVMSGPTPPTFNDQFPDPMQQQMQQFMAWQAQVQGMPTMPNMAGVQGMQPSMAPATFMRPNSVNRRGGFGRRATNVPNYGSYGYGNGNGNGTGSTFNQPMNYQVGMYGSASSYPSRPGTSLSSFSVDTPDYASSGASLGSGLSSLPSSQALQTYINRDEPVNYRRMLDKTVNCNWKFIVDKIVHSNDQQASIFLQQKLKVGTAEQKFEIIEAIIAQAYPLMVNRFGNFLVQRCFEHGTPEQVVAIANSIRGNTLSLSMDSFGCHVIQKAFDSVPEEYRVMMVNELLRRIPETVIHRYACHVWQKLFELRWTGEPPAIMKYVNDALYTMWHEVALGETGSLVVQNIFENCVEEEKRQCIEEVLGNIDLIAHGQFGNWCIQHICEHGAPNDMRRAVDHVLHRAVDYSIDQYASKVVEKCLKIKGNEFLSKYLAIVCEAKPERPRMALIDIAADQYGNYLIQYILGNATHHHREMVAAHVRKHMVSLRGSKFGSRVAMLCCNPAHVTRPGPGAGVQIQRYGAPGQGRFAGAQQTFN